ncbi:MAG: hypothetical protein WBX38_22195 [Candidatus Sulfotelmatobacter sp.]
MPHTMCPTAEVTPESFNYRLSLYSVAAMTAGVGMLALAQPAHAEVVVTRKTIPLMALNFGGSQVGIDLNNDGAVDVSFGLSSFGRYTYRQASIFLAGKNGGEVVTQGEGLRFPLVSALLRGGVIGPSAHFNPADPDAIVEQSNETHHTYSCLGRESYGHWRGNNPDRFVGVKFSIHGATHYGWVRLTVSTPKDSIGCNYMTATITSYAYETVANKKLTIGAGNDASENTQTGVPAPPSIRPSLGMLALGSDSIALWRRESIPN